MCCSARFIETLDLFEDPAEKVEEKKNDVPHTKMKYILVTGGVFSGVGKTVVSSSIGKMLKCHGLDVTFIKIDSYLNLDAGTCSSHGEVYVLDDGGEVDVDLGEYERTLEVTLHADNHITTGKMFKEVMGKERCGAYFGHNAQVQPHLTDAFRSYIERVAKIPVSTTGKVPEVCIIEMDKTIDEIENHPFIECFKQLKFTEAHDNFCLVHVPYVIKLNVTGEFKTKPAQNSISKLQAMGLSPDFVICRSQFHMTTNELQEISNSCHIPYKQIINLPELEKLYEIPYFLKIRGMASFLADRLNLKLHRELDKILEKQWLGLEATIMGLSQTVNVAVIGEYIKHKNRYPSIVEALTHAGIKVGCKVNIEFIKPNVLITAKEGTIEQFDCIVVSGGFGIHNKEGQIKASKVCREKKIPFLGIALGFHTAIMEMAETVDPNLKEDVVMVIPEATDENVPRSVRCGLKTSVFKDFVPSNLRLLNGNKKFFNGMKARHNSRYQINPKHIEVLEQNGVRFVGTDQNDERIVDIMELPDDVHPYYVGCRFHPEYTSRLYSPSPAFLGLLLSAKNQLKSYLIDQGPKSITHTIFQNYKKTAEEEKELEECNNVRSSFEHLNVDFLYENAHYAGGSDYRYELEDLEPGAPGTNWTSLESTCLEKNLI